MKSSAESGIRGLRRFKINTVENENRTTAGVDGQVEVGNLCISSETCPLGFVIFVFSFPLLL